MSVDLIGKLHLPPEGARVLCALSGGADSMCLLELLREWGGCELAAAHFEHGIRGGESLRDRAFVEEYCRKRGIECFSGSGDVPACAAERSLSIEEAARELRYAFLERTADERGFDFIATAHNADDNAETVLFNLARGTGAKGLCGIPPRRGRLIRPMLGISRAEIEEYLRERGIPHVEDSTNGDDSYSRNRIRHIVMPALRGINPALTRSIARTGELLRRDAECLDAMAAEFVEKHCADGSVPTDALLALHPAIASRVVLSLLGGAAQEKHVAAVLALCAGEGLGYADVPARRVRRERERLYFDDAESGVLQTAILPESGTLKLPEAGLEVSCRRVVFGGEINSEFKTYHLKCESIDGGITVTAPAVGDRYRPVRRGCTKTLKSLFSEKKFTQVQKRLTPVFRDESGIVLVPPFGEAERCKPEDGCEAFEIMIKNI